MADLGTGACVTCGREHVKGKWWPRHPFKPASPRKHCTFPTCNGGSCAHCASVNRAADMAVRYREARDAHVKRVLDEAFPEPRHDQESDVGHLMKRMLLGKLASEGFDAGWIAAGEVVPTTHRVSGETPTKGQEK